MICLLSLKNKCNAKTLVNAYLKEANLSRGDFVQTCEKHYKAEKDFIIYLKANILKAIFEAVCYGDLLVLHCFNLKR